MGGKAVFELFQCFKLRCEIGLSGLPVALCLLNIQPAPLQPACKGHHIFIRLRPADRCGEGVDRI